jgi:hypothetical protein
MTELIVKYICRKLADAGPTDTVFATTTEKVTSIVFGDGTYGAIPEAGSSIWAIYRKQSCCGRMRFKTNRPHRFKASSDG